jgi:hypothetical protein
VMPAPKTRRPLGRVGDRSSTRRFSSRAGVILGRHALRQPRLTRPHLQRWFVPPRHHRRAPTSMFCYLLVGENRHHLASPSPRSPCRQAARQGVPLTSWRPLTPQAAGQGVPGFEDHLQQHSPPPLDDGPFGRSSGSNTLRAAQTPLEPLFMAASQLSTSPLPR